MNNIALLVIDCLRFDESKLLEDSIRNLLKNSFPCNVDSFNQCYSTAPWTYPSTNSILTGLYPYRHGAYQHSNYKHSVREPWPATPHRITENLFHLLKQHHYKTIGISTIFWSLNPQCNYGPIDQLIRSEKQDLDYRNVPAEWVIQMAKECIQPNGKNQPWFLYAHFCDLHRPFDLSIAKKYCSEQLQVLEGIESWDSRPYRDDSEMLNLFKRNKLLFYRALIKYVATQIIDFIHYLIERDLWQNTTLIITADHGEEFWDHEKQEKTHYNCGYRSESDWHLGTGHGHTLYNELIQVPLLLINSTEQISRQKQNDLVSHIDLLPTILDLADIPQPTGIDGISVFSSEKHASVMSEALLYGWEKKCLIEKDRKLILAPHEGWMELYDTKNDPKEQRPTRTSFKKVLDSHTFHNSSIQRILDFEN